MEKIKKISILMLLTFVINTNGLRLAKKQTYQSFSFYKFYRLAEMPTSMLKKACINHLIAMGNNHGYQKAFSLNKDSLTFRMLLACLLMAIQEHSLARDILDMKQGTMVKELNLLRNNATTKILMQELELYENKPLKEVVNNLILLIEKIDFTPNRYKHCYIKGSYSTYYRDKKENMKINTKKTGKLNKKMFIKLYVNLSPRKFLT